MKFILPLLLLSLSSTLYAKSSEEERTEEKQFQLTLGTFVEYSDGWITLSAGYFLSPNDLILLRYTGTHTTENEPDKGILKYDIEVFTLGYRKFLGNSFNIMPSAYYLNYSEDRTTTTYFPDLSFEALGYGMRVGNEWQTDYFTYGCDWFGINHNLLVFNKNVKTGEKKSILNYTLLSFYVGVSF